MRISAYLLAGALVAGFGHAAKADQTDPKLDRLFADLKGAEPGDAAGLIEAEIWQTWGQANDTTVDQEMADGAALMTSGDLAGALTVFDKVVAQAPKFAEGWNKRATTLYFMGRLDDSKRDIGHVLALEPRHFGALSGLSMCEMRLNRTREAIEALERAQAIDPSLRGIAANIQQLKAKLARESI